MTRRLSAVASLILVLSALGAWAASPRRVLILRSFDRGSEPYETLSTSFRDGLVQAAKEPVDFREVFLDVALFGSPEHEKPSVDYLRSLDAENHFDLVVAMAGPAARFVQRNRASLFVATPLLIAGSDVRHVSIGALTDHDAEVGTRNDLTAVLRNMLLLLPGTREVVVVLGRSPLERFWAQAIRSDFRASAAGVRITSWDDLPLEKILERAAALPSGTAIFYGLYVQDVDGAPHRDDAVLEALRSATSVPIFGVFDFQLGRGIVGGPLLSPREIGLRAGQAAAAILRGAAPATLRPPPIGPGTPTYDWRELRRWGIDVSRLPPGSVIRFREPTFWEARRWTILGVAGIGLAQAALIVVLLVALVGRRRAEEGLRRSREQYALAVDGANDGLWDWDIRTGDVYLSPRLEAMIGYSPGELAARRETWDEHVHPDDRDRIVALLDDHLEGRAPSFQAEHRLRHRDGRYRWIIARGKAQRDAAGRPYRMAGSLTDVTDRRQAEDALRDMSRRLLVAQEDERARLARELHDDITQRLARAAIDAGRAEQAVGGTSAGAVLSGVREQLSRLSEDVHALSYRLHPSLLEDLGLAEALQVECEGFTRVTGVPADLDLGDLPDHVPRSAAICLYRVAQEALRNAERHAGAREVRVALSSGNGEIRLTVRDDGVGFDPSAERSRQSLGHASMRERIRLVGGEIQIESAPGHGTTIAAWVPLEGEGRP